MILIIDNYDSFTLNLAEYFHRLGKETRVLRNDLPIEKYFEKTYEGVVLSPGPQLPKDANLLLTLIDKFEKTHPILGICLGHQALNEYYGGSLKKLPSPKHGKLSTITHTNTSVFNTLPSPTSVVRYHSWEINSIAPNLEVLATSEEDSSIMAFRHLDKPVIGIQFHPESILTHFGMDILKNWLIVSGISYFVACK